jgi:hypothetical protein
VLRNVAEATVNLVKPGIKQLTSNLKASMPKTMAEKLFAMNEEFE